MNNAKAILVETFEPQNKEVREESFEEFRLLIQTLGIEIVAETSQVIKDINYGYFVGKGKVEELKQIAKLVSANFVFIDATLTYLQLRNLVREIGIPCIDRPRLILMIFSKRAKTAEGKMQVELSEFRMRLPEIVHSDTNLDQQTASLLGLKGPGERKTELKRRYIEKRIQVLEEKLKLIKKNREERRRRRRKSNVPVIAIVGYTNSGKSTLLNRLALLNDAYVENMPFATLDTLVRDADLGDNLHALLIDTIGFIRDLPHTLIYAFHSTLEEILDAWLILEIVDASDENFLDKITVVELTISELSAQNITRLLVFNKIDKISEERLALIKSKHNEAVFISALTGGGVNELKEGVKMHLGKSYVHEKVFVPLSEMHVLSEMFDNTKVASRKDLPDGVLLEIEGFLDNVSTYKKYFVKKKK